MKFSFAGRVLLLVVLQVAPPKGGGKGASAKKNFKRDWPEASASWERAAPAAPAQAAKGGGKRAKGSGKKEVVCFIYQINLNHILVKIYVFSRTRLGSIF